MLQQIQLADKPKVSDRLSLQADQAQGAVLRNLVHSAQVHHSVLQRPIDCARHHLPEHYTPDQLALQADIPAIPHLPYDQC